MRRKAKEPPLLVSDKVMLLGPLSAGAAPCFQPCPVMGQVYCVRDARDDDGIRLVGIAGIYEEGEEVWIVANKFWRISPAQPPPAFPRRRRKGGNP